MFPKDSGNGPCNLGANGPEDVTDMPDGYIDKDGSEVPALHQEVLSALEKLRGGRPQNLPTCPSTSSRAPLKCESAPPMGSYDANGGYSSPMFGGYADAVSSGARTPADADLSAGEPSPEPPDDFDAVGVWVPPSSDACGGGFGGGPSPKSSPGASPRNLLIPTDRPDGPRPASPTPVLGGGLAIAQGSPLQIPCSTMPSSLQKGHSTSSSGDRAGGHAAPTGHSPVHRDWRRVRGLVEGPLLNQLTDNVRAAVFAQMYASALRARLSGPPASDGFGEESAKSRSILAGFAPPGAALSSRESGPDRLAANILLVESTVPK